MLSDMKLLVVLAILIQSALAYRSCSPPENRYNGYINRNDVFECSGNNVPFDGKRAQCVAIIKEFCGGPQTTLWKQGTRVNKDKCNSIPKYTPIASFTGANGKYDGNNGHAGIFISCNNGDVVIADQYCGKSDKFNQRTLPKVCHSSPNRNCADNFYTIEW